jgi:hypothetical protein
LVTKLEDRSLGLTFDHATTRSFAVEAKKICKEHSFVCIDLSQIMCSESNQFFSSNHAGNCCFRILASMTVQSYSQAESKGIKSALVLGVVAMIRRAGGHFCKYENGAWFEVGDRYAREKVSALFRDMLHTQYRSSAENKSSRRTVRMKQERQPPQDSQQAEDGSDRNSIEDDDCSTSSSCWGFSLDGQDSESLVEDNFFDIDVF